MNVTARNASRWAAVLARDKAADGHFFYSVRTTGIYCRPSCPSRHARPENVGFHLSSAAAERAGFRPCKRCKPDRPSLQMEHAAKVAAACRQIASAAETPSLEALAKRAGLSSFHFHRVFKASTGLTPRQYGQAHRAGKLRSGLQRAGSVTNAIYEAGYGSSSRVYERSSQLLGMSPSRYRNGGEHSAIRFAVGECSLGSILVASSELGICAILMGEDPDRLTRDLQDRFPKAQLIGGDRKFERTMAKVIGLVELPGIGLQLPLDVRGTAFQQRVWEALRAIPAGSTASYTQIAQAIGAPRSVRAVAQACGANPAAIVIPCHRVVRSDGALSGYRWGVERKRELLAREAGKL
ncbi:MAG: bifunctional DNA-binding transcriptional regulator/O6-methylguanine-DNA methyltransferase Ada [Steroidobacteraceae bacterium]